VLGCVKLATEAEPCCFVLVDLVSSVVLMSSIVATVCSGAASRVSATTLHDRSSLLSRAPRPLRGVGPFVVRSLDNASKETPAAAALIIQLEASFFFVTVSVLFICVPCTAHIHSFITSTNFDPCLLQQQIRFVRAHPSQTPNQSINRSIHHTPTHLHRRPTMEKKSSNQIKSNQIKSTY
jgi:hypothetical protein